MITDKDIQKLKTVFATKEDLNSFSTKDDLKNFATKDDLKNFATKDDLEKLEIRTGESFIDVKDKIDNLENQFKDLKNEVISMEDHIIKEIQSMKLDQQASLSHRREIADHETRITKIEQKLLLA